MLKVNTGFRDNFSTNRHKEKQRMEMRSEALKQRIEVIMRMFPELHDDEEVRFDTLDGETDLKLFLQRCVINILLYEAEEQATRMTIGKLQDRLVKWQKRQNFYRALVSDIMHTANLTKVVLAEATLSMQNAPTKVIVTDELLLPEAAFEVKKTVSKTKIKELMKDGSVPGAELSNGGQMLVIR